MDTFQIIFSPSLFDDMKEGDAFYGNQQDFYFLAANKLKKRFEGLLFT